MKASTSVNPSKLPSLMFCLGQERIFSDSFAFTGPAVADVVGFYGSGDGWPSTFTITSTSCSRLRGHRCHGNGVHLAFVAHDPRRQFIKRIERFTFPTEILSIEAGILS